MRYNIAIVGLPRSGKTTKAKELFTGFTPAGTSIFINSQFEDYFNGFTTIYKISQDDLTNLIIPNNKFVLNPVDNENVLSFIESLLLFQKRSQTLIPIRLIIDEVKLYQDYPGAKNTLTKIVVDGLKWNIQTIITAHFPQMVESAIYKNCHVYYFFKMNRPLYEYFRRIWHIDLFQYADFLNRPYNFVLYDGSQFVTHEAGTVPEPSDPDPDTKTPDTPQDPATVQTNPAADVITDPGTRQGEP